MKKLLFILTLFCFSSVYAQTHIYKFNGVFTESGAVGPDLTEVLTTLEPSCLGTAGSFLTNATITTSACSRGPQEVFAFNAYGGVAYPNPSAFITGTYTINILFMFSDYNVGTFGFQRIIDLQDGSTDDGLYTSYNGGSPTIAFAIGGTPTYLTIASPLVASQYYLVTLVRDAGTDFLDVYLDGSLIDHHNDAAGIFTSAGVDPIVFFRDNTNPAQFPCESGPGAVRYLSIENAVSDATAVQATWLNICNGVLASNISSFAAQKNNNDARLQWQTGNETNTSYFDIERSYNGQTYTAIGRVSATHVSGSNTYNYTDQAVFSSSNVNAFYRLKIVDNNGSYEHSSVVKLTNNKNSKITLFPNPATDALSISGLHNTDIIRLISIDGKVLLQRNAGAESVIMHIEKYNRGTYIIQVQNGKEVIQQKFVKR